MALSRELEGAVVLDGPAAVGHQERGQAEGIRKLAVD